MVLGKQHNTGKNNKACASDLNQAQGTTAIGKEKTKYKMYS